MTLYNSYLRILRFAKGKVIPKCNKTLCPNVPFSHTKGYCYCSPARQTAGTALWVPTRPQPAAHLRPQHQSVKADHLAENLPRWSSSHPSPPPHMVAGRSSQAAQFPGLQKPNIFHVHLRGSFPRIQSCFHKRVSGWELSILTLDVINLWHSRG